MWNIVISLFTKFVPKNFFTKLPVFLKYLLPVVAIIGGSWYIMNMYSKVKTQALTIDKLQDQLDNCIASNELLAVRNKQNAEIAKVVADKESKRKDEFQAIIFKLARNQCKGNTHVKSPKSVKVPEKAETPTEDDAISSDDSYIEFLCTHGAATEELCSK